MQHSVTIGIIVILVVLGLYRRTRRTIGFQKFMKGRMLTRMAVLTIVGILFLSMGFAHPIGYIYDFAGVVLGGIIAYYAIRTTSFEWRQSAWFYRPNPWIGALLLVLFFGRIGYRLFEDYQLYGTTPTGHGQPANQTQLSAYSHDPATTIILFTLIAYYVAYYTFLIRRERHLEVEEQD